MIPSPPWQPSINLGKKKKDKLSNIQTPNKSQYKEHKFSKINKQVI